MRVCLYSQEGNSKAEAGVYATGLCALLHFLAEIEWQAAGSFDPGFHGASVHVSVSFTLHVRSDVELPKEIDTSDHRVFFYLCNGCRYADEARSMMRFEQFRPISGASLGNRAALSIDLDTWGLGTESQGQDRGSLGPSKGWVRLSQ